MFQDGASQITLPLRYQACLHNMSEQANHKSSVQLITDLHIISDSQYGDRGKDSQYSQCTEKNLDTTLENRYHGVGGQWN